MTRGPDFAHDLTPAEQRTLDRLLHQVAATATAPSATAPSAPVPPALPHPALAHPALPHPALDHPALAHPALADPALADPADPHPALAHPALADPALAHPALADPALAHPALADPAEVLIGAPSSTGGVNKVPFLSRVSGVSRVSGGSRGRRVGVAVIAAAVAAIGLATAVLPAALSSPPTVAGSASPVARLSTVEVLAGLGRAARQEPGLRPVIQRRVMVLMSQKLGTCATIAYQLATTIARARPEELPALGLEFGRVDSPDGVGPWLACPGQLITPDPTARVGYQKLFEGPTSADAEGWSGVMAKLRTSGYALPDLNDPRVLAGGLPIATLVPDRLSSALDKAASIGPDGVAGWWTALAGLLASPVCLAAVRAAAFDLAADPARAGVARVDPDAPADMFGRAGVTLRIPYALDGLTAEAALTFDPATGELWQRAVYLPAGQSWTTIVTAYQ